MIESRERHMNKAGTEIWLAFLEVRLQNDLEILLYQQERLVAQINGLWVIVISPFFTRGFYIINSVVKSCNKNHFEYFL